MSNSNKPTPETHPYVVQNLRDFLQGRHHNRSDQEILDCYYEAFAIDWTDENGKELSTEQGMLILLDELKEEEEI